MMTKWELKEQLESLRETNSKLTDANLVIAKQLENLWSEVGYKNDRVRDLTYEVSELKSEVKTLKFKWRKCIADRYAQDQEEKEKDKALNDPKEIDKLLENFGSVRVVKNWNWKERFDTADDAIEFLLKQLTMSRKITYYTLLFHKKLLIKKENSSIN